MAVTVHADGPLAWVEIDNPPVNAASHAVRAGLVAAVAEVDAMQGAKAAILICQGRTFVAGADVREFGKPPRAPLLSEVVQAVETAATPWIAAIHGTALGGGLELAMGCAWRIADADARLGLPEVNLGLIPGAGGTVRLPRLVGARRALAMVASGDPVGAVEARQIGLVDEVCKGDLRAAVRAFALARIGQARPTPVLARTLEPSEGLEAQIATISRKARGQNSLLAVCEAVQNSLRLPAERALEAERALFLKLKDDPQSRALRHIFFAERSAGKDLLSAANPRPLTRIGVIGGGTMGAGIAAAAILSGLAVTLVERDAEALSAGEARLRDILEGSVARGKIGRDALDESFAGFRGATGYAALADADLVIEAVFEDMAVKQAVFAELDRATRPDTVLATNTSYLDVGQIAQAVADPARVIGLHFFSPAHIMKLLELVVPEGANPAAIATGAALGRRLGKITVPAGVCDGFIGNRIMSAYRRAADCMIEDGALPADIDKAMRGFGFPMGLYEMQDLAGLDIAWAMRKRRAATRDPGERYVEIADRLCERGRFGRKSGRGWYRYDGGRAEVDPEVTALIEGESARKGIARKPFSPDEIMAGILTAMQAEGRACLAEGIAAKGSDMDVVMVNGYGFPRWRGGPMFMDESE